MPNPLTGDFEAVLQVSGATVNRLLASMHQNAFIDAERPSFPHSIQLQLGDPYTVEGVRGRVHAQIGVPRVHLIHGATDRFGLKVGVRAWFRPDHGSAPFPSFIHGTVQADYQVADIDPNCRGWRHKAANYLWVRVVRDSVRFSGTAEDDPVISLGWMAGAGGVDPAANLDKVTRQVAGLLATRFDATPHPVSPEFRKGMLRSLNVPTTGSAVALPLGITGPPSGAIASIHHVLLGAADLAVAVNVDVIRALAQPALAAVSAFNQTISVHVSTPWPAPDIDTVYRVRVDPPGLTWLPQGSHALLRISVHGTAKTNSILPDATFDIVQDVVLNYDGGTNRLWLSPGSYNIKVHASGLGSGTMASEVSKAIDRDLKKIVAGACAAAQPDLDAMTTRTMELTSQLRSLDAQASVALDQAEFLADGVVLRGRVALSPRHHGVVSTDKTPEGDAHTALESWLPGGRIDKFEWTWTWANGGRAGRATHVDRFLLQRPQPGPVGKWGIASGLRAPLPGLDGWGQVCLIVSGVQVDPVSGELTPVSTVRRCKRFGLIIRTEVGGLRLRDMPELSKDVPFPQLGLVRGAVTRGEADGNTLIVHAGEGWDRETAGTFQRALEMCGRFDAGLSVLVLFREGVIRGTDSPVLRDVDAIARESGVPMLVNEDVDGAWGRAFKISTGDTGWRLLSPAGVVTWSHDGRVAAEALTAALDTHLHATGAPSFDGLKSTVNEGAIFKGVLVRPLPGDIEASPCPTLPLTRSGVGSIVAFVQRGSLASEAHIRELMAEHGRREDGPEVVLVVGGARTEDVEALTRQLGVDFTAIADPDGSISDRVAVNVWPTTIRLDPAGRVANVD